MNILLLLLAGISIAQADTLAGAWNVSVHAQGERVAFATVRMDQTENQIAFKFTGAEFKGTVDGDRFRASRYR